MVKISHQEKCTRKLRLFLTVSPHRFYHRGVRLSRLAATKGFLMIYQR